LRREGKRGRHGIDVKEEKKGGTSAEKRRKEDIKQKVDAAPGLPGRSPIPVLFRPKGA
jgi:hypothetical protein